MFLQFTFARRLDFKMLISNSAIKRAGDQEKRNEKKKYTYICISSRVPRGTPAAPDRERVGVNYHCGTFAKDDGSRGEACG